MRQWWEILWLQGGELLTGIWSHSSFVCLLLFFNLGLFRVNKGFVECVCPWCQLLLADPKPSAYLQGGWYWQHRCFRRLRLSWCFLQHVFLSWRCWADLEVLYRYRWNRRDVMNKQQLLAHRSGRGPDGVGDCVWTDCFGFFFTRTKKWTWNRSIDAWTV